MILHYIIVMEQGSFCLNVGSSFLFIGILLKIMRIYVRVTPRASKNEVVKISDGEYKVKLTAPPVDGQANSMLLKVLADHFSVSRSSLQIIGGKTARIKIVDILK